MKRRILIPLDDDEIRNDEIERINRETRRLEEEAAHAERVREATAARDVAQQRLQRIVGNNNVQISSNDIDWNRPYLGPAPNEEPKVELQKVDTAKFVFLWENSSTVTDVAFGMQQPHYTGGVSEDDVALARHIAEVIRTVEKIPLRKLPDQRPTVKRSSRIQNFS